jgi:hypothetical protein
MTTDDDRAADARTESPERSESPLGPPPAGTPLKPPKGKQVASGWSERIAEAIRARESGKEARRGRPVGFPHSFSRK